MFNVVVVAVDGTGLSSIVIGTLENLNISPQGKVILAQVIPLPDPLVEVAADRPHNPESLSIEEVDQKLNSYKTQLNYPCEVEIVTGDAAIELVRLAHIYKADLIVMGNRGLTGVKRIIEGSVSSQVMAEAPCSVLVVKEPK